MKPLSCRPQILDVYGTGFGSAFHTDINYSITRVELAATGELRSLVR